VTPKLVERHQAVLVCICGSKVLRVRHLIARQLAIAILIEPLEGSRTNGLGFGTTTKARKEQKYQSGNGRLMGCFLDH
jgi:hypothetical protein